MNDNERMYRPHIPRVLSLTNHWRIVDGRMFRDCLVELPTGDRLVLPVLDSLLDGVAA